MTMDHSTIENILKADYNRETWKGFLRNLFPFSTFWSSPQSLDDLTSPYIASALRIGDVKLDESGIERSIGLFEVVLDEKVILERNRVGLRNLLRKYWKDMDGAFIVYTQPSSGLWRFTYVSELTGFDASGEYREIKTDPKRYTYVFGNGESCRTAVERFQTLLAKGKKATIADVIEAFSVEKLSKSFFDGYKKLYELFCEYLTAKPGIFKVTFNGDEKAVRDFVKLFLGRITFLYFIQKKGWLGVPLNGNWGDGDKHFLWSVFQSHKHKSLFYREVLTKLFFDTLNTPRESDLVELPDGEKVKIPFLNGGLFEEENSNYRNIVFKEDLFEDLFNFFNQYNFTIYEDDPNDHTVAVDPEMLGHIFENLLEDNKDKGAFYTPKEIVHYMSQESLIEYLSVWFESKGYEVVGHTSFKDTSETLFVNPNDYNHGQLELETPVYNEENKIDRSMIEKLLKKTLDDSDRSLIFQYIDEFNKALDSVKICDPAIGSGAFPMGLLQEIFAAKQTLWHFKYGNLDEFPASEIKLNIIQNSIYGVDIEKGAVDIARLRFWLSLVVDEVEPKPLPNLDYKIVVGNSLVSKLDDVVIDIDWNVDVTSSGFFGQQFLQKKSAILKEIIRTQKQYFFPESNKKLLALEIRNLKIDLLINHLNFLVKTEGLEEKPTWQGKKIAEQMNIYLKTQDWISLASSLKGLRGQSEESLQFFDWKLDFPEILNTHFTQTPGFDIVIGNPPYVSTKGIPAEAMAELSEAYGFADDLYNYFFVRSVDLLKKDGILSFITSDTYLTLESKANLRRLFLERRIIELIQTENVFEVPMVEPAIIMLRNAESAASDYEFVFKDAIDDFLSPKVYNINVKVYRDAPRKVLFPPTDFNLRVYSKYSRKISGLLETYWDCISTSKNISKNETVLKPYRDSLKPGDVSLLGLLTEGGQGLATGDNGSFVGVRSDSKWANNIRLSRPKKLFEALKKSQNNFKLRFESVKDAEFHLSNLSEIEIRSLFKEIKSKLGRDIFGQGYLYMIISGDEIADVSKLTEDEKQGGIDIIKPHFVPYDKGDKDGNRWYLETPYCLNWSKKSVKFLKKSPKARWQGYQFYFREGFCWSDINTIFLKARLKGNGVHDVKSMSLFSMKEELPDWFFVCIINSTFISNYVNEFVNNSQTFQINDARQLPIIIPTEEQLLVFRNIFEKSLEIKKKQFAQFLTFEEAEEKLAVLQRELDAKVLELYELNN